MSEHGHTARGRSAPGLRRLAWLAALMTVVMVVGAGGLGRAEEVGAADNVTLTPNSGPAGTAVTVAINVSAYQGSTCTDTTFRVYWGNSGQVATATWQCSSSLSLSLQFTVPGGATPGVYQVLVEGCPTAPTGGLCPFFPVNFTVTAPTTATATSTPPGGGQTTTPTPPASTPTPPPGECPQDDCRTPTPPSGGTSTPPTGSPTLPTSSPTRFTATPSMTATLSTSTPAGSQTRPAADPPSTGTGLAPAESSAVLPLTLAVAVVVISGGLTLLSLQRRSS